MRTKNALVRAKRNRNKFLGRFLRAIRGRQRARQPSVLCLYVSYEYVMCTRGLICVCSLYVGYLACYIFRGCTRIECVMWARNASGQPVFEFIPLLALALRDSETQRGCPHECDILHVLRRCLPIEHWADECPFIMCPFHKLKLWGYHAFNYETICWQ